jgi:hypothetical protein
MAQTFGFTVLVFFVLFALLLALRYRLACIEDRTEAAMDRLASR